jgi:hypothetical protein
VSVARISGQIGRHFHVYDQLVLFQSVISSTFLCNLHMEDWRHQSNELYFLTPPPMSAIAENIGLASECEPFSDITVTQSPSRVWHTQFCSSFSTSTWLHPMLCVLHYHGVQSTSDSLCFNRMITKLTITFSDGHQEGLMVS